MDKFCNSKGKRDISEDKSNAGFKKSSKKEFDVDKKSCFKNMEQKCFEDWNRNELSSHKLQTFKTFLNDEKSYSVSKDIFNKYSDPDFECEDFRTSDDDYNSDRETHRDVDKRFVGLLKELVDDVKREYGEVEELTKIKENERNAFAEIEKCELKDLQNREEKGYIHRTLVNEIRKLYNQPQN